MSEFAYGPGNGLLNLRRATQNAWRGITAYVNDKPFLVLDKDGDQYLIEDEEGNTGWVDRVQSWKGATENNKLVAASRLDGSPLSFLSKHANFIVGTLSYDGEEWGVRASDTNIILPIESLVENLEEGGWKHANLRFEGDFDAVDLESEDPIVCPNCGSHTVRALGIDKDSVATLKCLRCGNEFPRSVMKNPESSVKEGMRPQYETSDLSDQVVHAAVVRLGLPRISYEENNKLYGLAKEAVESHPDLDPDELAMLVADWFGSDMDSPGDTYPSDLLPGFEGSLVKEAPGKEHMKGVSPKRNRMYEDIKEQCIKDGGSEEHCKELAARTVNKYRAEHGETKNSDYDESYDQGADEPASGEVNCPMCGGPVMLLGQLGQRAHFRCRNCGAQFNLEGGIDNAGYGPDSGFEPPQSHVAASSHTPGTRVEITHPSAKGQKGSILKHKGTDGATEEDTYDILLDSGDKKEGLRGSDIKRIKSASPDVADQMEPTPEEDDFQAPERVSEQSKIIQWRKETLEQAGVDPDLAQTIAERYMPGHPEYIDLHQIVDMIGQGARPEQALDILSKRVLKNESVEYLNGTDPYFLDTMHFAAPIPGFGEECEYCSGEVDPTSHVCVRCGAMQPEMLQQQPRGPRFDQPHAYDIPFGSPSSPRHFMGADMPFGGDSSKPKNAPDSWEPEKLPGDPYDPKPQDQTHKEYMDDEPEEQPCPMCGGSLQNKGDLGARSHFKCSDCGMWFSRVNEDDAQKWDYDNDPDNLFGQDGPPGHFSSAEDKFADSQGNPLAAGKWYVMHGEGYKVPDLVRILNTEETHVEAAIESDVNGAFPIHIKGDEGYRFEPYEEAPKKDKEIVVGNWRIARKSYSPSEQRSLIDEGKGSVARNFDKLNLEGTHYLVKQDDDEDFLWS